MNYSLNGYLPQVVPVGPRTANVGSVDLAGGDADNFGGPGLPELAPNPVYAQLQPAPPPAPVKKKAQAAPETAAAVSCAEAALLIPIGAVDTDRAPPLKPAAAFGRLAQRESVPFTRERS